MAQSEITKEEVQDTIEAVEEILTALPKNKKIDFLGHFNEIFLFLEAVKRAAPEESS